MHTTAVVKYTSYHYLSGVDETARCSELRSSVEVPNGSYGLCGRKATLN